MYKTGGIKLSRKFMDNEFDLSKRELFVLLGISSFIYDEWSDENAFATNPISIETIMSRLQLTRDKNNRNYKMVQTAIQRLTAMRLLDRLYYFGDAFIYVVYLANDYYEYGKYLEVPYDVFEHLLEATRSTTRAASLISCYVTIAMQCFDPEITDEDDENSVDYLRKTQKCFYDETPRKIGLRYDVTERTAIDHLQDLIDRKVIFAVKATTDYNFTRYFFTLPKWKKHLTRYVESELQQGSINQYVVLSKHVKI